MEINKSGRKSSYFNLVEVALAMGVIGIGMAGIMALFPLALKASRDAVGQNYGGLAAEQFLSYLSMKCSQDWDTNMDAIPDGTKTAPASTVTNDWTGDFGNIYTTGTGLGNGVYGIRMNSGSMTDFSAHASVWKTPVTSTVYSSGEWKEFSDAEYCNSANLSIELSWPAEIPYAERFFKVYTIQVFYNQ